MRMAKQQISMEYALLGFLRRDSVHAYEISRRLSDAQSVGLVWHLKQSNLYSLLDKLEADGLITSLTISQGSRPPRKVLSLTDLGRERFDMWVISPVKHGRDFRMEFLAKLFFAAREGKITQLTDAQREECNKWLRELRTQIAASSGYQRVVYEFRLGQTEAFIAWLETHARSLAVA